MDSSDRVNQQELLSQVNASYREMFLDYRSSSNGLDSKLWFEDMHAEYILEVILANFAMVNLICERVNEEAVASSETEDQGDHMADYGMGYNLSEDCTSVTFFAKGKGIEVRDSLVDELFYAHVQYFNISNSAGRHGWFDVNKRLLSSMVRLIELKPDLMDLVDEWQQDVDDLDLEDSDFEEVSADLKWKKEFVDSILDYFKP
jgi:hypothetical protein